MADNFETTKQNINDHLNNIYKDGELNKYATVKEILTVQLEKQEVYIADLKKN